MQEQNKFKYIYNNEEVSREDFEKLAGDSFKWFDGDSIVSVPFSPFDSFFTGNFKSRRQINDHLDSVLNIYQNKVTEDIINKPKCSPQCYCDGSCKKPQEKSLGGYKIPNVKVNATRHKAREEGKFHKDDVITNNNRGEKETMEGVKHNQLKPRLDVVVNTQFPKALQLISLATEYGNYKYFETDKDMLNFKRVVGGSQTYFDSCARHSTDRNGLDESGLPHIIHAVWSSLAGLELWAEENKINVKKFTENYMKNLHNSK
jgi:hypothetical protein